MRFNDNTAVRLLIQKDSRGKINRKKMFMFLSLETLANRIGNKRLKITAFLPLRFTPALHSFFIWPIIRWAEEANQKTTSRFVWEDK
jgi:hypothetical protein